jgi:LemA protein
MEVQPAGQIGLCRPLRIPRWTAGPAGLGALYSRRDEPQASRAAVRRARVSTQQWLLLAGGALLIFWMLGAYNRLVTLRNAIIAAWTQFDEALQRRAAALEPLVAGLRHRLPAEQATLDALQSAQVQLHAAAEAMRARPALAARATAMAAAESALSSASMRLLALLEQQPAPAGDAGLAPHLAALQDAASRLDFGRQLFNEAVRAYNDAVQQFPTRLLSPLFGFVAAATL